MADDVSADISITRQGAIALVALTRTKALNALTDDMRQQLSRQLWAAARDPMTYAVVIESNSDRAFSAGSDVREVVGFARSDMVRARKAFADEYSLNWQWECFSKPTVSLIDGMVMGGGVGISLYGTHRVAGAGYKFAMPETIIGLFPDVGVCHALSRMPGHIGQYLGLLGRTIGRADAYALGLLTHCIGSDQYAAIKAELAEAWPVDPLLDRLHEDPGEGELAPFRETIDRCFSAATVEEIIARLSSVTGAHQAFAQGAIADFEKRSPLSLKITHRHIWEAARRDLRETLMIDYRIAVRTLDGREFYEGVRAQLIDKDQAPKWQPERLKDVTDAMVDAYFQPLGADDLVLPTRSDMQAARA